jgi:hypothetical protein
VAFFFQTNDALFATSKASCILNLKLDQSLHPSNSSRVPNYLTTDTYHVHRTERKLGAAHGRRHDHDRQWTVEHVADNPGPRRRVFHLDHFLHSVGLSGRRARGDAVHSEHDRPCRTCPGVLGTCIDLLGGCHTTFDDHGRRRLGSDEGRGRHLLSGFVRDHGELAKRTGTQREPSAAFVHLFRHTVGRVGDRCLARGAERPVWRQPVRARVHRPVSGHSPASAVIETGAELRGPGKDVGLRTLQGLAHGAVRCGTERRHGGLHLRRAAHLRACDRHVGRAGQ